MIAKLNLVETIFKINSNYYLHSNIYNLACHNEFVEILPNILNFYKKNMLVQRKLGFWGFLLK